MRIDVTLPPAALGLETPPPQTARSSFAALVSPLPPDATSEARIETRTALPRNVFSFDALGALGLGALGLGGLAETSAAVTGAPAKSGMARPAPHPQTQPLPLAFGAPAQTVVLSSASDMPSAMTPRPSQVQALSSDAPLAAVPIRATSAFVGTTVAVPAPASGGAPQAPVTAVLSRGMANALAVTSEIPQEAPPARKTAPAFRFQAEAAPSSEGISVILSESDGALNIAASAPGLTESDRRTLQRVADETAGETGLPLGELRLNGVVLRPFSKAR